MTTKKMKLYKATIVIDQKIIAEHLIRTKANLKEVNKKMKLRIKLQNKDIDFFATNDDLER